MMGLHSHAYEPVAMIGFSPLFFIWDYQYVVEYIYTCALRGGTTVILLIN